MSKDEKLLNLPPVPSPAEFEAETYPNWEADLDKTYAGIGPLTVAAAQHKADRDLSPFQSKETRDREARTQKYWDAFKHSAH